MGFAGSVVKLTHYQPEKSIHDIPFTESRDKACREIARVLKPGGLDFLHTFPPLRILQMEKGLEKRFRMDRG